MNERQKELLRILLTQEKEAFLIQGLSKQLQCSEKTTRNDLNRIEEFLAGHSDATLIRKPGIGVYLEAEVTERSELFQLLLSKEQHKTNEERRIEIAYQLLISNTPLTLEALAKHYYVTKKTIKKDMENIANWMQRFDLELLSKQRLGNAITGTELNKRSALAHLSQLIPTMEDTQNYVLDLFLPYEITIVRKYLHDLQVKYSLAFTDGAMESLLVHALIMIKRTKQKSPISIPEEEKLPSYLKKEYQYTGWFLDQLASAFQLTFPEEEKIYFTWHLISSKKRQDPSDDSLVPNDTVVKIITDLTTKLRQLTMIHFESDSVLINGLTVHMHSVINRLTYGFPITNPLLSDIKKMYPYMFNMVILALEEINEKYKIEIPEDEAAYLVLHFQAGIERLEGKREPMKRALIVCHMGIGMSHLLQVKMEQHYKDIYIVNCIGKADVPSFLKTNTIDFIISTVPLEKVRIPHIVVSPLLEAKDKESLRQFFSHLEQKASGSQDGSFLSKLIEKDLIHLNVEKEHRYEIVEMLGNALFQRGYVKETFNHSALVRERNSATAIGAGIAIPHGNPTMIKRSAIAVAVLSEPLEWGDQMVSLVFMLGISNDNQKQARGAVQQIASISEKPTSVQSLVEAKNVEEFLSLL
jgi:activator of the mannose operon, transcriptional antiterminator